MGRNVTDQMPWLQLGTGHCATATCSNLQVEMVIVDVAVRALATLAGFNKAVNTEVPSKMNDSVCNLPKAYELPKMSLAEFFQTGAPYSYTLITDATSGEFPGYSSYACPDIQLHCANEKCGGSRVFRTYTTLSCPEKMSFQFSKYTCSNCDENKKVYALVGIRDPSGGGGIFAKLGEHPKRSEPMPTRLFKMLGSEQSDFLKGKECEVQGFGVGAFAYYRRIVESQKNRILDQILKVAQRLNASQELLNELEVAKTETQFSKAVSSVKKTLPESLLIEGHSPLLLLHKALSEGIHDKSDEECLRLSTSIRAILFALADRIAQALKDDNEVKAAVSNLLNQKSV